MFQNIEELRELIKKGLTNEEIIKGRLLFLEEKTDEKNNLQQIFNETQVHFYRGFIKNEILISADYGYIDETLYRADIIELYDSIINDIRKNIDKKGIPMKVILNKVWNYFKMSDDSQYKELVDFMKMAVPNDRYIARAYLPYIIQEYNCSNYIGSITDFGKAFMYNRFGKENTKLSHKEEIEKMKSSINWEKIENEPNICDLSSLKGAGIAACTEKSMAIQNILAFLGFESYIIAGTLTDGKNTEEHNFNVVKDSKGNYIIIDAAQYTIQPLEGISEPEQLMNLDNVSAQNGFGNQIAYSSNIEMIKIK